MIAMTARIRVTSAGVGERVWLTKSLRALQFQGLGGEGAGGRAEQLKLGKQFTLRSRSWGILPAC